jgi:tetratricopeptide (TPR) repeat protein
MSHTDSTTARPHSNVGNLIHPRGLATWIAGVAISYFALGLLIYSNVILNGIFVIDDFDYIVNNPSTEDLRSFLFDLHELRLVGYVTFALNRLAGGINPTGYHLVNALIHIINAILVAWISYCVLHLATTKEYTSEQWRFFAFGGAIVGLVFLVHPLQTQAVSYISQRFTVLATFFYLLAVSSYISMRKASETQTFLTSGLLYGMSVAACALAMKTKEISFTIPFAIGLIELLFFQTSRFSWRRWVFLAPYLAMLLVIPLSLFAVELGLSQPANRVYENMRIAKQADLLALSPYTYLITQFRVVMRYLSLFVFPVGLRAQHDFEASESILEPGVLASMIVLFGIGVIGFCLWRRSRRMDPARAPWAALSAFGIFWFFLTASVESSVIPIKHLVFEHRMYLPSVGLVSTVAGLAVLACHGPIYRRSVLPAVWTVVTLIVVSLATGTYVRNRVWTDAIRFWSDVIEKSPRLLAGWHNRAVEHRNAGNIDLALADLNHGVAHVASSFRTSSSWPDPDLNPENVAKVYGVRAKLLARSGAFDKAEKDFLQVLGLYRIAQERGLVLNILVDIADTFRDRGSCNAAIPLYSRILTIVPGNLDARYHRGWCLASLGRIQEGLEDLNRVLQVDPAASQVYFDRAAIHRELGLSAEALQDLDISCRLGFVPACNALERPGHDSILEPAVLPERGAHGL